ncbi:hypothetical protein FA15DRAFT_339543 [Coprinopsis marcescibilis]|uniref:P-loop containing nucleoside triphosphate hydrolase protein n=1 Tax=Coprinopsis marcescibilis TaxID=230819 RepID=A0A5C3KYU4_COPMA|nr:hypothetical protein FA15DRAFT_339543 [Coprinopsis marcescibilis]
MDSVSEAAQKVDEAFSSEAVVAPAENTNLNPATLETFQHDGQVVLILCGLVASGKSTFAESLQAHFPHFRRCNQDDLGDRRSVEKLVRQSLSQGLSVCVDRTNFNVSQRFHWIKIAREFPGISIWVIVLDTPYEVRFSKPPWMCRSWSTDTVLIHYLPPKSQVCAARLQHRTGHPTITSPEQGLSILSRFSADFEPPESHEGYHRIIHLRPGDHSSPEYTRSDVLAILQRVRDSEPVVASRNPFPNYHSSGNSSSRGAWNHQNRATGQSFPYRGRRGSAGPNTHNNHILNPGGHNLNNTIATGLSTSFRGWGAPPFRGGARGTSTPARGRGAQQGTNYYRGDQWRRPNVNSNSDSAGGGGGG